MRDLRDYLEDIIDAMLKSQEFISGMSYDQFVSDDKTIFAVLRSLEVIGEAAKNIPKDFREEHLEVPWKEMAGMRDVLIHAYFGVDKQTVWLTVTDKIPKLLPEIKALLE
ncbi:MAG: DUF86 domain-containing protein [Deltaproteobacteria bacterium]|nr:DUF86 domain-containing protein [Deltaproteobacteria bacterium]